jgi:hypothetical protein
MTELIALTALAAEANPDHFLATIEMILEGETETETVLYSSTPSDTHGIAVEVRAAITDWLNAGKPVTPYVPKTPDEVRWRLPMLTRRQLLLALASIGIMEDDVSATLSDPLDLIEWKYASEYERLNPLLVDVAETFGLPPEHVDDLWKWASAL